MAHTLTSHQKRLLKQLLEIGRWNNESEIIRYGLHLVAREVQTEHSRSLEPIPKRELLKAYRKLSVQDRAEEWAMERASAGPGKGELD